MQTSRRQRRTSDASQSALWLVRLEARKHRIVVVCFDILVIELIYSIVVIAYSIVVMAYSIVVMSYRIVVMA